jgi:hypothetical protein
MNAFVNNFKKQKNSSLRSKFNTAVCVSIFHERFFNRTRGSEQKFLEILNMQEFIAYFWLRKNPSGWDRNAILVQFVKRPIFFS